MAYFHSRANGNRGDPQLHDFPGFIKAKGVKDTNGTFSTRVIERAVFQCQSVNDQHWLCPKLFRVGGCPLGPSCDRNHKSTAAVNLTAANLGLTCFCCGTFDSGCRIGKPASLISADELRANPQLLELLKSKNVQRDTQALMCRQCWGKILNVTDAETAQNRQLYQGATKVFADFNSLQSHLVEIHQSSDNILKADALIKKNQE